MFILAGSVMFSESIWSADLQKGSETVISNTATATFQISGQPFLVESSPTGNSIPGPGKGAPLIIVLPPSGTINSQNQSFSSSTATPP